MTSKHISRRKLLQVAGAGLVAGFTAPLISSHALAAERKVLIAYYSRTDTTREVAKQIARSVGGNLFELKTTHSYPKEYRATTHQAKKEQEVNFRPQLTAELPNADSYDIVFVGYPNWWGSLPMAFFSFLERYRFAGKTIVPFCTHEGSGLGRGVSDIKALCPRSTVLEGLALHGGGVDNVQSEAARREVAEWLKKIGMTA